MADLSQPNNQFYAKADDHLSRLLAPQADEPWYKSFIQNIKDAINPPKLPPLELTSKPVAVKDIWGLYGRQKKSFMMSTGFQIAVVAVLFTVFSSKVVQQQVKQVATLIMPADVPEFMPKAEVKKQVMGGCGPGEGGGVGGGVYRVGGGVTAPALLAKVEPEYSEEARKAKYQGTVLLYIEVDPSGKATNIRVARSLGLGLDEKAIEAVKKWKFKAGQKNGVPVTVAATIEVNFRLL